MGNIISWSGGKDSTATIILAHELGIPIDVVVIALLYFDKERGIYAADHDHIEWLMKFAIPTIKSWGYNVKIYEAMHDYMYWFNKIIEHSKLAGINGKKKGFLIGGMCRLTAEKQSTIKRIDRDHKGCTHIIGICSDEPERIERMVKRGQRSLLSENGFTQEDARRICEEYGLLSPIYRKHGRDGCLFCPNASIKQYARLKTERPDLYGELEKMSKDKNLVSYGFKYGKTFQEVDEMVDEYLKKPKQMDLFGNIEF